ncbi:hypothetical protein D3C72_1857280 [compost metagenome]
MIERGGFGNAPAALADDDDDLALVVELRAFGRADQRLLMPGEGARETDEQRRVGGCRLAVPVLFVAIREVDADADDLFRCGDRDLEADIGQRKIRGECAGLVREPCQGAVRDDLAQRRPFRAVAPRQIDDAVIGDKAVSLAAAR